MGDFRCELALLIDNNATDNFAHRVAIVESHLAQEVKVVTSGKEAISFLKKNNKLPQLILFDVHIPVIEGQVFLHEYAGLTHFNKDDVRIVVLTYSDKAAYLDRLLINDEITTIEIKPLTHETCERLGELV